MFTYSIQQNDDISAPCILLFLFKGLWLRPEKCHIKQIHPWLVFTLCSELSAGGVRLWGEQRVVPFGEWRDFLIPTGVFVTPSKRGPQ